MYSQNSNNIELTIDNKEDIITISYNDNWILDNSDDILLELIHKSKENSDEFRENITLLTIENLIGYDSNALILNNRLYLKQNRNAKIIDEEIMFLNNTKTYRVIYEQTTEGIKYKVLQYLQLANNTRYTLTFISELKNFSKFENEVSTIMETFKVHKKEK